MIVALLIIMVLALAGVALSSSHRWQEFWAVLGLAAFFSTPVWLILF